MALLKTGLISHPVSSSLHIRRSACNNVQCGLLDRVNTMRLCARSEYRFTPVILHKHVPPGTYNPNSLLLLRRGGTPGEKGKIVVAGRPPVYFWGIILCTNERICGSTEKSYCNVLQPGSVPTAPNLHSTAVASTII